MKKLILSVAGLMVLNGCSSIKAYRNFQSNVATFLSGSINGKVDCPMACETLKQYINDRYGVKNK